MLRGCIVLLLLSTVALADINADIWEGYADQIRRSSGFADLIKQNPDLTLSIAAKSSMVLLGNEQACIHNQAVQTLADSLGSPGPVFVPSAGGFFSAYKLFLNSIKPKTTNNPSLIPQLAKDKQNFIKLSDTFSAMQRDVFAGYREYKESMADVPASKRLDIISWRTKYFPKYTLIENSLAAAKTKIDKAETELWGPAFTTIQDAKKKIAMAESMETQTAFNMPVCPLAASKSLQDYENPDNLAGGGGGGDGGDGSGAAAVFESYTPQYSLQGAQQFLDEMRNAALHEGGGGGEELRVQVTKSKSTFAASDFGWDASASVSYGLFFSGSGSAQSKTSKKSGTNDFDNIDIAFAGHRTLTISPPPWFDSALVTTFYDSLYPDMAGKLFGPKGGFNVIPRQVVLGYNPTFRIQMSKEAWDSYNKDFSAKAGASFGIGPFGVSASGGATEHDESRNYSYQNGVLTINTRSDALYMLAVIGQKVVPTQKSFMGKYKHKAEKQQDHLLMQEDGDDDSKNLVSWSHHHQHAENDALTFELNDVRVETGEVTFAFTKDGFNIEKTDDAVFNADLNIKSGGTHQLPK